MLNPECIKTGLHNFGLNASGTQHVYKNLSIMGRDIEDITPLATYFYLQNINLSNNKIKDLLALGSMQHLSMLNASNNNISMLLNFKPPLALKFVNMSNNEIEEIGNLCSHLYLQWLLLSNNKISKIEGLQNCSFLSHLDLSCNKLSQIHGLDNLPIKFLNLSCNLITCIENLSTLEKLEMINLSYNNIRSLAGLGLGKHPLLENINISNNEVIDLSEINHIVNLIQLRKLYLQDNPMMMQMESRLAIIFKLQKLSILNNDPVTPEEKVASVNLFDPSMQYIATRDHMMHVVYSFMRPNFVLDITLPSLKMNYPILILVGPQGMSKTWLSLKIAKDFHEHFAFVPSCTTRAPRLDEKHGVDYFFVPLSEFEMLIKTGQFIQTISRHNELYGTTIQAIDTVAKEALACILRMEIEGVLSIKQTSLKPLCVYVLPKNIDVFEKRLYALGLYTDEHIKEIIKRVDVYREHVKRNLDVNDAVIYADNPECTYSQLKDMVQYVLSAVPSSYDAEDSIATARSNSGNQQQQQQMQQQMQHGAQAAASPKSICSSVDLSSPGVSKGNMVYGGNFGAPETIFVSSMDNQRRNILAGEDARKDESSFYNLQDGQTKNNYDESANNIRTSYSLPLYGGRSLTNARPYSAPLLNLDLQNLTPSQNRSTWSLVGSTSQPRGGSSISRRPITSS